MNRLARMLVWLLAVSLMIGLVPVSAFAEGAAIQLVENGTAADISGGGTNDYIYYGKWDGDPIKWRVLSIDGNGGTYKDAAGNTYSGSPLFLLSDVLLGTGDYGDVYFDSTSPYSNVWQGSDAQAWCKDFAGIAGSSVVDAFTAAELDAVLATIKSDGGFTTSNTWSVPFSASDKILNGDRVFFLSAEEAETMAYGFADDAARIAYYGNSAGGWWLRSPSSPYGTYSGVVSNGGLVLRDTVFYSRAARPAFNVNLNSVLFTSAAEGGKISAASGGGLSGDEAADAIFEIPTIDTNEWKLTVLDSSRSFEVDKTPITAVAGNAIDLDYTGATTGNNEYISVILADGDGAQYYGRVLKPDSENGKVSVALPENLSAGRYTLKVFSEQCNGDYQTDYASAFCDVELTILPPSVPETGDSAKPALWLAMGILSVAGLLLLRRKEYGR